MRRREFLAGCAAGALMTTWRARANPQPLVFDATAFETLTTVVEGRPVTYRFWKAVAYVAQPVAAEYQTLNVSVPVAIGGVPLDASAAPILLANSIGGYMPSSVSQATGVGESARLALAAGLVVVEPGARGRSLVDGMGVYIGVAPAVIIDLKAAVRYVRSNAGRIPGNVARIFSSGVSAGGAVSALLGASGDSPLYEPWLREIGAAEGSDAIYGVGSWCPITDLEHADAAYEWNWGTDSPISAELRNAFADYQASLDLPGLNADNYGAYLVEKYLKPSATAYLQGLTASERAAYLAAYPQFRWEGEAAVFDWEGFLMHVGTRKKGLPAFDSFDLSTAENNLFGGGQLKARHFTPFSLRRTVGRRSAELDPDLPLKIQLMNPMGFLREGNPGRARHWWFRVGSRDTDTSLTVVSNLSAQAEKLGDAVNTRYYWDAGHGANEDAAAFVAWMRASAIQG